MSSGFSENKGLGVWGAQSCGLKKTWSWQARREVGVTGALAPSHRCQRSTFLLIRDLKKSEVGVLFYSNLMIV